MEPGNLPSHQETPTRAHAAAESGGVAQEGRDGGNGAVQLEVPAHGGECKFHLGEGPKGFEDPCHCIAVYMVNKGYVQYQASS
jgi:hypothetical protein